MTGIQDQDARRDFLRRAGKASLGIPATALLLSVTQKRAFAVKNGYDLKGNCGGGNGDDPAPPGEGNGNCGLGGSSG